MNTKPNVGLFARRSLVAAAANLLIVVVLFLCAQTTLRAQTVNATLTGTATDQSGALLPGVTVRITNNQTGFQREVQSGEDGNFNFPALPPATYTVSASRDGFAPAQINDLTLNVNDNRSLRIEMRVGSVDEAVTVTDEPSLVEQSAAQSTTVDRTFAGNLPLNGRSLQSLFLLAPGVVPTRSDNSGSGSTPGGFSVNGQRTNSNYFTVDGVSGNVESTATPSNSSLVGAAVNGSLPALSTLGTTSTLVSVDALEEFKIQTSTFSAEYGRQPGGQVQLVTRSGGTDFHGSIYDYVRNDIFDANNFFNNARGIERPPLRQNNFGGTLSGPVFLPRFGEGGPAFYNGRKRTFFFFSYEGLRLRLPNSSGSRNVPSLRLRQLVTNAFQPILNAYPIPTGDEILSSCNPTTPGCSPNGTRPSGVAPFQTVYSDPSSTDSYSIRLDHNLTNKITIFGRYNQAPSTRQVRTLNVLNGASNDLRTLTVGTTFVASSKLSNDFRFNYSRNRGRSFESMDDFGGAVPIDASLLTAGYSGPGPVRGSVSFGSFLPGLAGITLGDSQDSYQRQFNIVDTVSFVTGAHQFKFGADFRRLMPTYAPAAYSQGALVTTEAQLLSGRTLFTTINARLGVEPRFNNYSFYAQDTWKASQRLTLDLGLRYEFNPAPKNANDVQPLVLQGIVGTDVSGATIAPSGTPFFKPFKTAFAPRFGAVYQLRKKPGRETVMRGGFGVYYDLGSSTALNAFDAYPFFYGSPTLFGATFPLTPTQAVAAPPPSLTVPLPTGTDAIDPNLKLPYTYQYNFGVEQSLGKDQALSVSYVGSAARRLLATQALNVQNNAGQFPNPNIRGTIFYTVNGPTSNYDSLQAQYQRRLSSGFQALVNYTWSHAIDEGSDELNAGVYDRGNSAFDVRHNFSAALTYIIPKFFKNRAINAVVHGWSANSIILLQSGQPIDIIAGQFTLPDGRNVNVRPDYVAGQPFWIEQAGVPGGRRINPAAFVRPPRVGNATSAFARQGTLGRNVVTAPGIFQVNFGLQREFKLTEALRINFRGEAFNLFNRPQFSSFRTNLSTLSVFGIPNQTLNNGLGGGNALYQIGGPRSLQFSARLSF